MKRICVAGSSHRAEAQQRLSPVLSHWAEAWCLLPANIALPLAEPSIDDTPALAEYAYHSDRGSIYVGMTSESWRELVLGPLASQLPDDDISRHLLDSARRALLQAIATELAIDGTITATPSKVLPRSETVLLPTTCNGACLLIGIEASLLQGKTGDSKPTPLLKRQDAIDKATLQLRVELPLLTVAMGDFLDLKPGDIIHGQAGLDTALHVLLEENRLPVTASLGAQGLHKAIKLRS